MFMYIAMYDTVYVSVLLYKQGQICIEMVTWDQTML